MKFIGRCLILSAFVALTACGGASSPGGDDMMGGSGGDAQGGSGGGSAGSAGLAGAAGGTAGRSSTGGAGGGTAGSAGQQAGTGGSAGSGGQSGTAGSAGNQAGQGGALKPDGGATLSDAGTSSDAGTGPGTSSYDEKDPRARNWVFLMCGQSNMSGTSPIEAEDRMPAARVFKLTSSKTWATGTEGFNISPWSSKTGAPSDIGSLNLSPSRVFGMELVKKTSDPDVTIYIVNAAMSGSNIESWDPATGENFKTMIPFLEEAMKKGFVRGFIWHQGEANGGTPPAEYAGKLKAIIKAIRDKVGHADMPAVAGEVGTTSDEGNVNRALAMIAASDARFGVATSENLTLNDNVHYSSASEREFGRRYAEAYWKIVTK